MFCRAKISALLTLAGTLTAAGASLNPEQRNTTFQPGGSAVINRATVLKPSAAAAWSQAPIWPGARVRKIATGAPAAGEVAINGFTFKKATEAAARPPPVKLAGGGR
jgi:hypothetical protein